MSYSASDTNSARKRDGIHGRALTHQEKASLPVYGGHPCHTQVPMPQIITADYPEGGPSSMGPRTVLRQIPSWRDGQWHPDGNLASQVQLSARAQNISGCRYPVHQTTHFRELFSQTHNDPDRIQYNPGMQSPQWNYSTRWDSHRGTETVFNGMSHADSRAESRTVAKGVREIQHPYVSDLQDRVLLRDQPLYTAAPHGRSMRVPAQ